MLGKTFVEAQGIRYCPDLSKEARLPEPASPLTPTVLMRSVITPGYGAVKYRSGPSPKGSAREGVSTKPEAVSIGPREKPHREGQADRASLPY